MSARPWSLTDRTESLSLCGIAFSKSLCYLAVWAVLARWTNESVSGSGRVVRHCLQMRGAAALVLLLGGWHASVDDTTRQR